MAWIKHNNLWEPQRNICHGWPQSPNDSSSSSHSVSPSYGEEYVHINGWVLRIVLVHHYSLQRKVFGLRKQNRHCYYLLHLWRWVNFIFNWTRGSDAMKTNWILIMDDRIRIVGGAIPLKKKVMRVQRGLLTKCFSVALVNWCFWSKPLNF